MKGGEKYDRCYLGESCSKTSINFRCSESSCFVNHHYRINYLMNVK